MTLWEVLVPVRDPECPRDAFSFTPFRLEVGRKASSLHFQFRVLFRERFFRAISAKDVVGGGPTTLRTRVVLWPKVSRWPRAPPWSSLPRCSMSEGEGYPSSVTRDEPRVSKTRNIAPGFYYSFT